MNDAANRLPNTFETFAGIGKFIGVSHISPEFYAKHSHPVEMASAFLRLVASEHRALENALRAALPLSLTEGAAHMQQAFQEALFSKRIDLTSNLALLIGEVDHEGRVVPNPACAGPLLDGRPARRAGAGRQERLQPGPTALPLPRLRQDLQRPDGHAAGWASHQGAILRAGRVPRPGHDRAGGCRRALRASSAALPARPPPSSAEVMRARGRPAAHPAASAAWPARCVRAPGRAD